MYRSQALAACLKCWLREMQMLPKADHRKKKGSCEGTTVMWQVVCHGTTGKISRAASKITSAHPNPEEWTRRHTFR